MIANLLESDSDILEREPDPFAKLIHSEINPEDKLEVVISRLARRSSFGYRIDPSLRAKSQLREAQSILPTPTVGVDFSEPTVALSQLYRAGGVASSLTGIVSLSFIGLYQTALLHPLISVSLLVVGPLFCMMGNIVKPQND